jgi:hypothetical protein
VRAEVRAAGERSSASTPRHPADAAGGGCRGDENRVELVNPLLDGHDVGAALEQELGPEAVAPVHLEREPADVANAFLTPAHERAALASQPARLRNALERALRIRLARRPAVASPRDGRVDGRPASEELS